MCFSFEWFAENLCRNPSKYSIFNFNVQASSWHYLATTTLGMDRFQDSCKALTQYETRLYTADKKGNSKYYCCIINKHGKMDGWVQKNFDTKNKLL